MKRKKYLYYIILSLVVIISLYSAFRIHLRLISIRENEGWADIETSRDMSPLLAFTTIALGGFRGIIADVLWMRTYELQDEGRFFELVQLADWITKLEPQFTSVWAFHAWNLAYNVSIMFHEPEDRWRWVQQGISLLRDEALEINPGSPTLCCELGWLYQHKVGYVMDGAHWYYKIQLAKQMTNLFNAASPDYDQLPPDTARKMKEKYKLDPEIMKKIDEQYGPVDWRLPYAHSLYWAYRAFRLSPEGNTALRAQRMIYQSLTTAFRSGKLVLFNPETELFVTVPNLQIIPKIVKAYQETMTSHEHELLHTAYANFLTEVILVLYSYNRMDKAEEIFGLLERKYPSQYTSLGFDEFVRRLLFENITSATREDAMALVEGFAVQGYLAQALGDDQGASGLKHLSQLLWKQYMENLGREDHRKRTGLPPWNIISQNALQRTLHELQQTNLATNLKASVKQAK